MTLALPASVLGAPFKTVGKSAGRLVRAWKKRQIVRFSQRIDELKVFDAEGYLAVNVDVAKAGLDPFFHYTNHGWREGRRPVAWFSTDRYRRLRPDYHGTQSPLMHLAGLRAKDARRLVVDMRVAHYQDRSKERAPTGLDEGICLRGCLSSEIGLGQAARNLVYALDAEKIPATLLDIQLPGRMTDATFAARYGRTTDRFVQIYVGSGLWFQSYARHMRRDCLNIFYPFWELSRVSEQSVSHLDCFDEIWAPSRYVQETFRASTRRPVTWVPQPVRIPDLPNERTYPVGPFTILTYLDFDSYSARKNPEGVVAAFQLAFPADRKDVKLVIKARGGEDRGCRASLVEMAAVDRRIEIIDATLDREAMDRLILDCDAFISLHRSEGFGFGPAEALAAAKPVVSTDYSGTTDFINAETGYPVAYRLLPVGEDTYVEWRDHVWAEPDIEDAARRLLEIEGDRKAARVKGVRGRQLLIEKFSPEAVGQQVREMLEVRGLLVPSGT